MVSEQLVAAGIGAMNLFGTLLLGWVVVIAFAIHVTHSEHTSHGNLATPPLAVVGSIGFASLAVVFYAAEQTFVSGFETLPPELAHLETVVFGFLAMTTFIFVGLVTRPLADSLVPLVRRVVHRPRSARYAAYGLSFAFETLLTVGTAYLLVSSLPALAA